MTNKINTALVYFVTLVLLSTLVITPVSISNSYWGMAYVEEQLIDEQIINVTNATSTEQVTEEPFIISESTEEAPEIT